MSSNSDYVSVIKMQNQLGRGFPEQMADSSTILLYKLIYGLVSSASAPTVSTTHRQVTSSNVLKHRIVKIKISCSCTVLSE